jgi:Tfp pilus assembly protein PilZ
VAEDRRHEQRIPVLMDIKLEGGAGKYEARTGDLSNGGCFVETIAKAEVGDRVNFKLRLPSGEWLDLQGEVTYEYPNVGFGVHFTNLSDDHQKRLEWLVKAERYRAERHEANDADNHD